MIYTKRVVSQPFHKKVYYSTLLLLIMLMLSGCSKYFIADKEPLNKGNSDLNPATAIDDSIHQGNTSSNETPVLDEQPTPEPHFILYPDGETLETRINTPKGYHRLSSASEELATFLRTFPLKPNNSPVLLYDGNEKNNQSNHVAVFDMDIGDRDLQQCADSIMRIYSEYYWSQGEYDHIAFHLTNGFLMEYTKWRDGNRLVVEGNDVSWSKQKDYDDSYESFRQYLNMVFAYAGTLSLTQESDPISLDDIKPGDLFLQGGSPGHCVMIVDIAEDSSGNRSFLLAQGYMPAQEFHILVNPLHDEDPWYYEDELTYPFLTPSWTFKEGSLVRWGEFPMTSADSNQSPSLDNTEPSDEGAFEAVSDTKDNETNKSSGSAIPAMSNQANLSSSDKNQVTLLAVGDNLIHIEVVKSGKRVDGTYNFDHLYANLVDDISAADIAVINQETILGGDNFTYSGYPNFNSPTEIGDAIVKVGFDVVLHATNHTMDKGVKAIHNTFEYWAENPEIMVLGINESQEKRDTIPIVEKNGIRIAMLNYTYGLNGYQVPNGMPYLINLLDKKSMKTDIEKAKELADFVIVYPHWGAEYVYQPVSMQKELVEFYYDLGVDLVIGTHPHVLEPVEWIETDPGHRMLVYYSLGNFLSYQKEAPRMLGGMATVTITKDDSGTYISDAGITPIVTHYEIGPLDYNYGLFKIENYTPDQALLHGVSQIATQGEFNYDDTLALAKQVLGPWYIPE